MILAPFLHFKNVDFSVKSHGEKYNQEDIIDVLDNALDDYIDLDGCHLDKIK